MTMRRILLAVLAFTALTHTIKAEELKGKAAHSLISGSNWIRTSEWSDFPSFISLKPEAQFPNEQFGMWLGSHFKQKGLSIELLEETTDHLGITHKRYRQVVQGIPVANSMINVHIKNGLVYRINGDLFSNLPQDVQPQLSSQAALQTALSFVGASAYKWELPEEEAHLKLEQNDPSATYYPSAKEVFFYDTKAKEAYRCFQFNIYAAAPLSRQLVYVDVASGNIVFSEDKIHHADAVGTAVTKYSGTKTIVADSTFNSFRLRESGRGNGVNTFNMQQGTNHGNAVDFTDADNFWNNVNAAQDEVATDAHWGSEMMYDYLLNVHNRNSIDGNGFALNTYVHYGNNFANAFWDGQRMTYGDGSGNTTPFTTVDIAGHEIAHGLTNFSAGLIYQDQSGALNESFSDIFGTALEIFARPNNNNWLVGEDMGLVIRSMSNPGAYGDPDTYLGNSWYTGTADNGGVHINSGVQNKWFYILTDGEQGTNDLGDAYNVTGIGVIDAAKVAFRNLTVYLTPNSNYPEARFFGILSAIDLFGACTPEVGAVTDAWYAVGVGSPYSPNVIADFDAPNKTNCAAPFEVNFSNYAVNGTSFNWSFGDGNTSTAIAPTHTYAAPGTYDVSLQVDGGTCGADTSVKSAFVVIAPNEPCDIIMPSSGTASTQLDCQGTLLDAGGRSGNYQDNSNSQITIAPPGATTLTLFMNQFDVEAGNNSFCNFDYLEVYNGASTSAPLIGRYCNSNMPPASITTNGEATIIFFSDGGLNNPGFEIDWVCSFPNVPPTVEFTSDGTFDCNGIVEFTDQSLYAPDTWNWDFGDGNTSTDPDPTHEYSESGTYTVTLQASNSFGTGTLSKTAYVTINLAPEPVNDGPYLLCTKLGPTRDIWASSSASGNIEWFDANGNFIALSDTINTGALTGATTFYARETTPGPSNYVGAVDNSIGQGTIFNNDQYLIFDAYTDFRLDSVFVISGQSANRTIELRNSQGTVIEDTTIFIPAGQYQIPLFFDVPVGIDHQLGVNSSSTISMYRNLNGPTYPYTLPGVCSITRSSANTDPYQYYYFFYNWVIQGADCVSDLAEIVVNVDNECTNVGVDEYAQIQYYVYPNPARSAFTIDWEGSSTKSFQLTTVTGQLIEQRQLSGGSANWNVSGLSGGIYFIRPVGTGEPPVRIVIQ